MWMDTFVPIMLMIINWCCKSNQQKYSTSVNETNIWQDKLERVLSTFAGPSDTGSANPAVQFALFQMGQAVLAEQASVRDITINMPNVHNLPLD